LGWPPVEGPRYRGSGPLWRTAAPDVVSRSRRIGEVGGCSFVGYGSCPVTLRNGRVCRHS